MISLWQSRIPLYLVVQNCLYLERFIMIFLKHSKNISHALLHSKNITKILQVPFYTFCGKSADSESRSQDHQSVKDEHCGTDYTNWVLARSANFNHDVSYLKRRYGRDRYNIHKLTNMEFMRKLVNKEEEYALNLNQNIVLLAQMNHVCNVLKIDKGMYGEFVTLTKRITKGIADPNDYVCMGTFMNVLVDLGQFNEELWVLIMDALFVKKYDEQYDELFGLYSGLYKYKKNVEDFSDFFEIQKNKIIYNIPIIYRNSLEIIRQYVKFNIYNLKECRILLRTLYGCKINEKYFWRSVYTWFNIYIKEQLERKEFQQFFIVSESAIDKVLFDDGIIRPRSILEELAEVAFILSEQGFLSGRFVDFIEHLIIYSIQNGSRLFSKYLDVERSQENQGQQTQGQKLNEHIKTVRQSQAEALKSLHKKYKTIFVNPTDIKSQAIVHILTVFRRTFESRGSQNEETSSTDRPRTGAIDQRVLNWLIVKLCKPEMRYNLNELVKIIDCSHFLSVIHLDLKSLIIEKVKNVRSKVCSLADVRSILNFLPLLEFESISYILKDFLYRAHPKEIIQLTELIQLESMSTEDFQQSEEQSFSPKSHLQEENQIDYAIKAKQKEKRWMPYMTQYFLNLPGSVNAHEKYYSFDENCYFLYILLKNEEYWESKIDYQYSGEMEKLKHSIKIASYSRGFKLQMGTYFYKLMNYIDLVAFFDGG